MKREAEELNALHKQSGAPELKKPKPVRGKVKVNGEFKLVFDQKIAGLKYLEAAFGGK